MTASRERFELGLSPIGFQVRRRMQCHFDRELARGDGGMIGASPVFYNTTSETGPQLAEYQAKAGTQDAEVLAIFQDFKRPLSPSEVLALYPYMALPPPLTSIRRAITTLTQAGALVKTETKRKGVYGRSEFVSSLPTDGSGNTDSGSCATANG